MALISRDRAHDAGAVLAPIALVVGAALATASITGIAHDRDRWRAAAEKPTPTATTTVTAAPRPVTATATPSASTSHGSQSPGVAAVSDRVSVRLNPASAHKPHSAPGRPTPTTQQPAPAACSGRLLTVQLLHQCVTVGGSK